MDKELFKNVNPMRYDELKRRHPDAVILMRNGDTYQTFGKDAEEVADILGIKPPKTKPGEAHGIRVTTLPHHLLEEYLPKLIRAGKRCAICEDWSNR